MKQIILKIESEVQDLEKKGLLPYIENPDKNNILSIKNKIFTKCVIRMDLIEKLRCHSLTD